MVNGCNRESVEQDYHLLLTDPPLAYFRGSIQTDADSLSERGETFSQVNFKPGIIDSSSFSFDGLNRLNHLSGFVWKPFHGTDSVLQLDRLLGGGDNQIAYIAERVEMPCDTSLYLSMGSDDGFILWVNGDSIYLKN